MSFRTGLLTDHTLETLAMTRGPKGQGEHPANLSGKRTEASFKQAKALSLSFVCFPFVVRQHGIPLWDVFFIFI